MQERKRNIVTCILLGFVTLGIYWIYWGVKLAEDIAFISKDKSKQTQDALLLVFIPCLGSYMIEKRFYPICNENGYKRDDRSIVYIVLGLFVFGLIDFALIQNDINELYDVIDKNGGVTSVVNTDGSTAAANAIGSDEKIISELKEYKSLLDSGVITQEEFDTKKAQLLNMMNRG